MNLDSIKTIDKSDMFSSICSLPNQIEDSFKMIEKLEFNSSYYKINSILILGMGGSAISGQFVEAILNDEVDIPIFVNKNYDIPNWVNERTLIIASSYSGNTEETTTSSMLCLKRKSPFIVLTTGGQLLEIAQKYNLNYILLPNGHQPRATIGYGISLLLLFLNKIGIVKDRLIEDLKSTITILIEDTKNYSLLDKKLNLSIKIASKIHNKFPIIYAQDGIYHQIAYRFRCQLAENAKILSLHHSIPEMNHNEIEGFTKNSIMIRHCVVLWIYNEKIRSRNLKRITITSDILSGIIQDQIKINFINDENNICIALRNICFLDWVSYYCAILNGIDPSIIPNIKALKDKL